MTDKELFETLSYKPKHVNEVLTSELTSETFEYCDGYKAFLNDAKTEREAVRRSVELAKAQGFQCICEKDQLSPGDKVYSVNNGKGIILAVIGKEKISDGVNLVGAHIDSPRIDLKLRPIFETENMAWLKTQYYGGIKK